MKLLHLLCSTIELVFGLLASVARLNLLIGCLDGSRFFKKPAGIVCHAFEAFSRVCILLKLEMIGFLPIIFKLFFRVTGFAPLLRMFSNLGIRSNDISQVFNINQEILFDQCSEQMWPLFQFISVVFLVLSLVFSCCVSVFLGSLKPAVFYFITCVSYCTEIVIA